MLQGRLVVQTPAGSQQPHMIRNTLVQVSGRLKKREKVSRYVSIVGVEPTSVNNKTFKSRWSRCTANGELEFTRANYARSEPYGGLRCY